MNRKWILYILLLISCFIVAGCVKGSVDIKVHKDGSADVVYDIAFPERFLSLSDSEFNPVEEMEQSAEAEGYSIEHYQENGYVGVSAKKHITDVQEVFQEEFFTQTLDESENTALTVDEGFFYNTYKINMDLDFSEEVGEVDWVSTVFLSYIDFELKLSLPIKLTDHNASSVENESGYHTYIWDITPNQTNAIQFAIRVPNIKNILFTVIGGLVVISICIYFVWKRRKKRSSSRRVKEK